MRVTRCVSCIFDNIHFNRDSMKAWLCVILILPVGLFFSCKSAKDKKQKTRTEKSLNGTWELNYITAEEDLFSFEELYPSRKPTLVFNLRENKFSGNTGCNSFNGELKTEGNKINFTEPIAMTKMWCEGQGENKFLEILKNVNAYSISEDNTLALLSGDIAILRFSKK